MADRRRRLRWPLLAGGLAAVVVVGGGSAAWALSASAGPDYRLATVGTQDVTRSLLLGGTVTPVNMATARFPVAGEVATVAVRTGQRVASGTTLATLNGTAAAAAVAAAQASLASAQAKVATDEQSQSAAVTSTGSGTGAAGGSGAVTALAGEQQAVRAGQQKVDAALRLATAALDGARTACASVLAGGGTASLPPNSGTGRRPSPSASPAPSATPSAASPRTGSTGGAGGTASLPPNSGTGRRPSPSASPAPSATPSASPAPSTTSPAPSATPSAAPPRTLSTGAGGGCISALAGVGRDQQQVAAAESALDSAENVLAAALARAVSAAGSTGSQPAAGSTGSRPAASSGQPVSAAQLAADTASADAASAQLAAAEQAAAEGTLVAPISGTVAAVSLTPGQRVGANSATADVVIIGAGSVQAVVDVADTQVPQLRLGQPATVVPAGTTTSIPAAVTTIGSDSPVTSATGSVSYPVTLTLAGPAAARVPAEADATVSIVTATASRALAVPNSAVTRLGTFATVRVDRGGTVTTTPVTVGLVGPVYTQVLSGLSAGEQVVLANLSEPVPTSTNPFALRRLVGGGGGFVRFAGRGAAGAGAATGRAGG